MWSQVQVLAGTFIYRRYMSRSRFYQKRNDKWSKWARNNAQRKIRAMERLLNKIDIVWEKLPIKLREMFHGWT